VPGVTLAHVGECVEAGLWLEENGRRRALEPRGYEHALY
jgi:thiamine-monophosphate kinase